MITDVRVTVPLNTRQVLFLQALCCGQKPAAAARSAGYSIASGVHLIRNPAIRAALREVHENIAYVVRQMEAHPAENERADA
jgi:phage terminase small subunit